MSIHHGKLTKDHGRFSMTEMGGLVMEVPPSVKTLVLHMCCAPDSAYIFRTLKENAPFDIVGFFYDPNIHPKEEYDLRLEEARYLSREMGVPVHEGEYDAEEFFRRSKGMEKEPELGRRCTMCFDMRLERTARFCDEAGFDAFATVLTVSRHKDSNVINGAGKAVAANHPGLRYAASNFKKRDGFQKSAAEGERLGLYRQEYCGCVYAMPLDAHPKLRDFYGDMRSRVEGLAEVEEGEGAPAPERRGH